MRTLTLHLQDPDGTLHTFTCRSGKSLMQAAVAAGMDGIAADCGGSLSCATCHVIVAPAWRARLPPASSDEAAMLELTACPQEAGSRLSCQVVLTPELDGLSARLPASQY